MIGHAKTLAALIFIAGTVALGFEDEFFTEDTTDNLGPLEVTKGEFEANRLYRREPELKRSQEAQLAEASHVRLQNEAALAVIQGTRRRPGSHNNRATSKPAIRRGCVTEGAIFAEGSAMVSPDECSYCFCIRGKQRCVAPKCLLPVEGCRPRYRTFSCCPSYYDCHDASTTTTTTSRTPRDCQVDGVRYSEGSLVEGAGGECENCYCLDGEVTCTRTTCAPSLDGCKPVMQEGHCCPVKYDCDDGNRRVSVEQFFKDFPVKISTADQRREFDRMRPEWQTNMARQSPGGDTIIADTENERVSGVGHVGEAFLVQDFYELTTPPSIQHEQIEIGTGVNVKGSLSDAVAFGPILIFDNRVRTDRQHKDVNTTEVDVASDEENTVVTDIPEETTMPTKADNVDDEKVITDEATAHTELLTDYDEGTEELTTLFPTFPFVRDTTVKSLSELLSTATAASTVTITETPANVSSPAIDTLENSTGDDPEYTDIETSFPSYDITVGTSVLATNQAQPPSSGVGEVISVELKPEHKAPEIESAPEVDIERPSLLGTILNILTRTERPRPSRLPLPPPPRPPFRPRPRPNGRPNTRPDFIPPRFRFTPPSPVASDRDTTEEPETNTVTSPPAPLIILTTRSPLIVIPTSQPTSVINRPVLGFNRLPTPIINIPVHSATRPEVIPGHPGLSNRPDFFLNHPVAVASQPNIHGLPSEPVIEGGFEGMRDNEEGIQPNFDFSDYDNNEEPTLPPSLPNLKIIPFVAADALVNQEIGIAGDEFLATPLLLADAGDDNQDTQRPAETTEATTTTTTRRPFLRLPIGDRRPPILPPRRTGVRPGDGSTTRRPFFRRPGERPLRPPFSSKTSTTTTTTTTSAPEKEEPVGLPKPIPNFRPNIPFTNRERSSTRPPFIPPRRHTPTTATPTTTKSTTTKPTTTPSTTTRRPQVFITTPRPIVSDDIANLLLQDVFGLSGSQNTPPVRFTPVRTTPKPIIPVKISPVLPEIPSAVRDQLPLATDPILASGLLKLSGCNIYGRMYNVGEQIRELSGACKECRCTPVGVQCLPVC